jgi:polar amino acid transport system substrate-binding protein
MSEKMQVPCRLRLGFTFSAPAGLLSCLLLVFVCAFHATAAATPTEVAIYADDGYPPYSYVENGQLKGIYTEILKKAFQKMPEYRVTLIPVPWKRGLKLLETGQGFALYPPYYRPDERPYILYSEPVLTEQVAVFCSNAIAEKKALKTWPDDYFGLTVGMNAGFLLGGKQFDQAVSTGKIRVDAGTSSRSSLLKLLTGRIDCYVNDRLSILWEVERIKRTGDAGGSRILITETAKLGSEQGFLGYTDRDAGRFPFKEHFIKQFNSVIADMKRSGEIARIVNHFLHSDQ